MAETTVFSVPGSTTQTSAPSDPQSTAQGNGGRSNKKDLGTGEIVGIVIGILSLFATVAGVLVMWRHRQTTI